MKIIAEKIHASRIIPNNHPRLRDGQYLYDGVNALPIIQAESGPACSHAKPFVSAAHFLLHGSAHEQRAAENFIAHHATQQTAAHATWLDICVDECSNDLAEREAVMRRFVNITLAASPLPLSIDAADTSVLVAGLSTCHEAGRPALLNSVTPSRLDALEHAVRYNTGVILLPTPDGGVPATPAARCEVLRGLLSHAQNAGIKLNACYLDPIVMPIGMDPRAVTTTLETTRLIREIFGNEIHITGGVSNVSYGLPARAIINRAFVHYFLQSGANTAILDPLLVTQEHIKNPDVESPDFLAAKKLLEGADEYGMDYMEAFNEGRLSIKLNL